MKDECLFCKIIKGDISSFKIYEDEKMYAFLDIMPVNPGHTLVVPKKHYENLIDTPDEILCAIIKTIKKIVPAILQGVAAEGFNLGVNNGKNADQIINHLHFHIMPRFPNDKHQLLRQGSYEEGDAKRIQSEILGMMRIII